MEVIADDVPKDTPEIPLPANNTEENTPTPLPEPSKKSKKEDRSKKDDKNVEQFMKSLNSVPTLDEKLSLVCKKYVQTADDNKKLQFYIKQSDKRYALLIKEKEQLQHEFNKTVLVKSKLENLCRELQKQNKAVKEESFLKIREEEERRKETQAKFQNTLTEITALLQQNNEKNAKLRDDNTSMTEKFKSVVQQYQLREQQVDKMAKQMALESQLSDAKLQKASLEHQAERERIMSEMEQLKVTLGQYRAKIIELQGTETALKGQLAVYTDKYDEFQNALVKSNQVFGGFKEQMEKMSKKIQKLEKESLSWKNRFEISQKALLDMCEERQGSEERASTAARHLTHMQGLCRTLQAERTVLLNTLKEHNIERPPLPTPPPAPAPAPVPISQAPASNAKVDAMAANCAQLRQSLAHLQTQLNTLTNKKEESPKPEKQKKSKSKKNKSEKQKANQEKNEKLETKDSSEDNQITEEIKVNDEVSKDEAVDNEIKDSLIEALRNLDIVQEPQGVVVEEIVEPVEAIKQVEAINKIVDPVEPSNKIVDAVETSNKIVDPVGPNNKIVDPVEPNNKIVESIEPINKIVEHVEICNKIVELVEPTNKIIEPVEPSNKIIESVAPINKIVEPVKLGNKIVESSDKVVESVESVQVNTENVLPDGLIGETNNIILKDIDIVKIASNLNKDCDNNTVLQEDSKVN